MIIDFKWSIEDVLANSSATLNGGMNMKMAVTADKTVDSSNRLRVNHDTAANCHGRVAVLLT
jgi:hypothetical protein